MFWQPFSSVLLLRSLTENCLLACLQLYRTLNIRVMLVGLEIWTHRDYIDVDKNSEKTLDKFLLWRQADLLQRTKHDTAQFVT